MKRELFALGSAIYEFSAWEQLFPELTDDEADSKYAWEFPSVEGNISRHILWNCWAEAYETAQEVADDLGAPKTITEEQPELYQAMYIPPSPSNCCD